MTRYKYEVKPWRKECGKDRIYNDWFTERKNDLVKYLELITSIQNRCL